MSMEAENTNLHDVEDFSSDIPGDQLPSVEEVRAQAGLAVKEGGGSNGRRCWVWATGVVLVTLVIVAIAVPLSNRAPRGDKQIGKNVEKAVHRISLNGKSDFDDASTYHSISKRWLMEDNIVKDYTYDQLQQRYAMYSLYHATGGSSWVEASGWKRKGVPECRWFGVTCNEKQIVTRINLRENGITGQIPPEVSLMKGLTSFNVNANLELEGEMPSHICKVSRERGLDVRADCDTIDCDCCTNCEWRRNRF